MIRQFCCQSWDCCQLLLNTYPQSKIRSLINCYIILKFALSASHFSSQMTGQSQISAQFLTQGRSKNKHSASSTLKRYCRSRLFFTNNKKSLFIFFPTNIRSPRLWKLYLSPIICLQRLICLLIACVNCLLNFAVKHKRTKIKSYVKFQLKAI